MVGHWALLTGPDQAAEYLVPVKALAAAVLFHHHQGQTLHSLIGGEPLVAR